LSIDKKLSSFPIVEIIWDDAAAENGWDDAPTFAHPQLCATLGFLVFANEDYVIVASTVSEGSTNSRIQIPRAMIKAMREVGLTTKRKKEPKKDASGTLQD
jgi:hypothetical protein